MITFEILSEEEKIERALAEIYTLLLKLAKEKKDGTLKTEYPPEYNSARGMAHSSRRGKTNRLSSRTYS